MFNTFCAFFSLTFLAVIFVCGAMECNLLLSSDNSYLAHSKLGDVFAGFNEIFNTVHRSESLKKNLNTKLLNFIELLLATKKIELELKALDESKFNRTMKELCNESSSDSLWFRFTNEILRATIEVKTILTPIMGANELNLSLRPRLG